MFRKIKSARKPQRDDTGNNHNPVPRSPPIQEPSGMGSEEHDIPGPQTAFGYAPPVPTSQGGPSASGYGPPSPTSQGGPTASGYGPPSPTSQGGPAASGSGSPFPGYGPPFPGYGHHFPGYGPPPGPGGSSSAPSWPHTQNGYPPASPGPQNQYTPSKAPPINDIYLRPQNVNPDGTRVSNHYTGSPWAQHNASSPQPAGNGGGKVHFESRPTFTMGGKIRTTGNSTGGPPCPLVKNIDCFGVENIIEIQAAPSNGSKPRVRRMETEILDSEFSNPRPGENVTFNSMPHFEVDSEMVIPEGVQVVENTRCYKVTSKKVYKESE
ncbi:hypothetical protein M413DRAFT_423197 [Hebeloma cylindrosporum]|uniref:Uncharacterized protein n=1 Tax=Hebeloma cylindrosporum TaxID=76867 RepID=A0A0C2XHR4_HEBCY|nr:hypothetical protein M413DRAFT_423197 [Hebeloma cylindrosporum h7]